MKRREEKVYRLEDERGRSRDRSVFLQLNGVRKACNLRLMKLGDVKLQC